MIRRAALKLIAALPLNQLQNIPAKTYQIYLSESVPIEVFYKGEKVTIDPSEIFNALKYGKLA